MQAAFNVTQIVRCQGNAGHGAEQHTLIFTYKILSLFFSALKIYEQFLDDEFSPNKTNRSVQR